MSFRESAIFAPLQNASIKASSETRFTNKILPARGPPTNLPVVSISKFRFPSKNHIEEYVSDIESNQDKDIEERQDQSFSANKLPLSAIASNTRERSLLKLSCNFSDSRNLNANPSAPCNHDLFTLPLGNLRNEATNDIKPPSSRNNGKLIFSSRSLNFAEGKVSPPKSEGTYFSNSKSYKSKASTEGSPSTQETKLKTDINMSSLPDVPSSPLNNDKADFFKQTPLKAKSDKHNFESFENTPLRKVITFDYPKNNDFYKQNKTGSDNVGISPEGFQKYFENFKSFEVFNSSQTWIKQIFTSNPRKNIKCSCDNGLELNKTCRRALGWIHKRFKSREFDYLKRTYEKIVADNKICDSKQIKQIQKDVYRTYPSSLLFKTDSEGAISLERLLNAFAKYDPVVGYVQGMNFIAGSLLYHAEEYLAFWILVSIFEVLEMRDVFLPRLPGLSKHCQIIDMLLLNFLPTIYSKLCKFEIRAEIYCSEWILTLFSGVVPIENMGTIYDNLFEEGWPFFYKLILAFLDNFRKDLEAQGDLIEMLTLLKSQNHLLKNSNKDGKNYSTNWQILCKKARGIDINSNFIYEMHLQFDNNKLWFKTT